MPSATRHRLLRPVFIALGLAVAMLLAHVVFVISDADDDEFRKESIGIRWFSRAFENTIYRFDYYVLGVDRQKSLFDGLQSTESKVAALFALWWFIFFSAALLFGALKRRVGRRN
jgi:hypothetical protein